MNCLVYNILYYMYLYSCRHTVAAAMLQPRSTGTSGTTSSKRAALTVTTAPGNNHFWPDVSKLNTSGSALRVVQASSGSTAEAIEVHGMWSTVQSFKTEHLLLQHTRHIGA